jgi:4'-phosphopantetheinyl transferase N-terminal domain
VAETAPRSILVSKLRKTAAPPLVAGCRAVLRRNHHATVIFVERAWTIIFSFLGPTDGGKANDPLPTAIERLTVPGILIGHRFIMLGDERALLPEDRIASKHAKIRRASGAARIVARELLARAGQKMCAIPKLPSGAPIWPAKIVGSVAHDSDVAVAAIAARGSFATIGIDVERRKRCHLKLLNIVATLLWQSAMASHCHGDRLY